MTAGLLGKVYLVGAGPGDPELITLKGKRCLEAADVILFDELANRELLDFATAGATLIYVGKKAGEHCADQREIEALMIDHARQGNKVVRLKGGDPFVFGRGGEEAQALSGAGIPFEIVPGISSVIAAPAYAGIPLTHRRLASSFAVVTGHNAADFADAKIEILAQGVDTLVIVMGLAKIGQIMSRLLTGGCAPDRPAALIEFGTLPTQRKVVGTVSTIAELAARLRFRSPTLIIVGLVGQLAAELDWFSKEDFTSKVGQWRAADSDERQQSFS